MPHHSPIMPWWSEPFGATTRHVFHASTLCSSHTLAQQWIEGKTIPLIPFSVETLRPDTWVWLRANQQTEGRGQGKNTFFCPPGGLYASLICFWPNLPAVPPLALVTALAIAESVSEQCQLKWVNDIFLGENKLGGILIDRHWNTPLHTCIISFGLNINTSDTHTPQQRTISSWMNTTGSSLDLSALLFRIHDQLYKRYCTIIQNGGFLGSNLCNAINRRLRECGQEVLCTTASGSVQGLCQGISEAGRLIIGCENGSKEHDVLTLCILQRTEYSGTVKPL